MVTSFIIIKMEPTEESLVKIDAVISGIRMINLHVFNYFCDHPNPNPKQPRENRLERMRDQTNNELKKLNAAHMQEHLKFVSEYIKKCLKDMDKVKFVLPPLTFRVLRNRLMEDDFLRYENANYGVKFVFTDFFKDCLLNIEIYRKSGGGRTSGLAMKKLQCTFLYEMSLRYPDATLTFEILEVEGKAILEEVTYLFGGEKCSVCHRHQAFNNETMCFLPPTVREIIEGGGKENKEGKRDRKYYHESCL